MSDNEHETTGERKREFVESVIGSNVDMDGRFHDVARDAVLSEMAELLECGCPPAGTLDFYAVEKAGWSQDEWADVRGVPNSSVSQNTRRAKRALALAVFDTDDDQ